MVRVLPLAAEWSPLAWDGRKAWSRRLGSAPSAVGSVVLAVWEDGTAEQWEWEMLDEAEDRHLAGGSAPTARDALDAAIALAERGAP
ncbi:hypothetical protein L2Y96_01765 [Luteibacter aegosomaticola]|uniref:hypothetical protein n=1 Tax=Luteibacter aegosomaticola TaxID=2911538 RepID=UPI001FF75848|nr:hypothetical protein [Luteibacter aegosomaticola]UPG90521.1 hypothetical protein L2Y96_01765 [Luteibacter aegosomaticola]